MTNEATRNKLIEMRLSAMANAFDAQRDDPNMSSLSFANRFGLLVDIEYCQRKNSQKNSGKTVDSLRHLNIHHKQSTSFSVKLVCI